MRRRSMLLARLALRRRPVLYWALTALLALLTAVLLGALTARAQQATARYGERQTVVVAVADIGAGDTISARDVVREERPVALLPRDLVSDPAGRVALAPIYAGEPLVAGRLAPDGVRGVAALLPAGTRALAVPTGPGSLRLAVGDTVDVLAVTDPGLAEGSPGQGETVTRAAFVVDVTPDTVTVAVASADAAEVAAALTQGTVTLALSAP